MSTSNIYVSGTDYDVVIIGAGPAGSSAATRLAAAGLRTLIVEKESFPRFRIGESLLPHGNALLRETGVWPKIESAGFVPKFGASFHLADGSADKEVVFSTSMIRGLDQTYQVERARFDAILLDHARESGAEARLATSVVAVESDAEGHRVSLRAEIDGARTEVTARWIVDSSGRDQFYPNELKRSLDPSPFPKRVAIYNHFENVPRADGPVGGNTIVVRLAEGWFWIIPIDATRTSVGLVTTVEAMRRARLEPAALFEQAVASSAKLRALMAGASPVMSFHVTSDYSYVRRKLAAGRMILTGDAGGFLDPIFSSGVYMACHSAKRAAELVVRAHRQQRPLTERECRRYTREFKAHSAVFRKLITAFYDNDSFSVFMCPQPPFGLAPAITAIVAGHARLTWPMWWRFQVFLLVCRLQRHLPLVPRLNVAESSPAPLGASA